MEYVIQLIEDPQMISVTITGKWDPAADRAMALEVMAKAAESMVGRVLVDVRQLQFDLPMINLFQRAKELGEQRREFNLVNGKVALVYQPTDKKRDDSLIFFENASRNRGLPYRVFKELDAALEWLMK